MRAIEDMRGRDDEGLTAHEWSKALNHSYDWTCRALNTLKGSGRLVVGQKTGQDLAGRARTYPVYRLVNGASKR